MPKMWAKISPLLRASMKAIAITDPRRPRPIFDELARLIEVRPASQDSVELGFRSPKIAATARPGQFVDVLLPPGDFGYRVFESEAEWLGAEPRPRPFLVRRPFSVYRTYRTDRTDRTDPTDRADGGEEAGAPDSIDILVRMIGPGSRVLGKLPAGADVRILGPLGSSFELPPPDAPAALVAGGCGWANLELLARELRRRGQRTYAFIGARTIEELPIPTAEGRRPHPVLDDLPQACVTSRELEELGVIVALSAEQGGRVYGGLVTELLEKFLKSGPGRGAHIYACGPWGMLRRIAELARDYEAACQVALEERMGCGLGVCNSCVVEVRLPDGSIGHKRLCEDGPVLDAYEVNWAAARH